MILVTGATGFLGTELAMQLVQLKQHIICTRRPTSQVPPVLKPYYQQITWVEADILDVPALDDAMQGVKQVYHCAAMITFNPDKAKQIIKNNVEGTANVVNMCLKHHARLVHVSSIAAIGESRPGVMITEETHLEETPHQGGAYAISKYESEMEVWRGIAEGLSAVIVNPSLIIGASAGACGTGRIFDRVRTGLKYYTRGSCGFVDVVDVAQCMILLMNSDIKSERFIISAENRMYKDLLTEAATDFGIEPPAREAKHWMLMVAWRVTAVWSVLSGKARGLDQVSARAASKKLHYDNSKIKNAIGFEFKPISLTIKEICAALR